MADHLANVVSVRGPPNFFPYLLGKFLFSFSGTSTEIFIKISDDRFLVISPPSRNFKFSQIPCIFQGQAHKFPFAVCLVTHIKKIINSQPWSRPTSQMSASHQWAAAHRLRTAALL